MITRATVVCSTEVTLEVPDNFSDSEAKELIINCAKIGLRTKKEVIVKCIERPQLEEKP